MIENSEGKDYCFSEYFKFLDFLETFQVFKCDAILLQEMIAELSHIIPLGEPHRRLGVLT